MLDNLDFNFATFAQNAGQFLDILGVLAILLGIVAATVTIAAQSFDGKKTHFLYRTYRHNLARSILIGLEFLVAGDIIRTVAGELHLEGIIELALIVLVRSVVSLEFEMNIEGRWPWNRARDEKKSR